MSSVSETPTLWYQPLHILFWKYPFNFNVLRTISTPPQKPVDYEGNFNIDKLVFKLDCSEQSYIDPSPGLTPRLSPASVRGS